MKSTFVAITFVSAAYAIDCTAKEPNWDDAKTMLKCMAYGCDAAIEAIDSSTDATSYAKAVADKAEEIAKCPELNKCDALNRQLYCYNAECDAGVPSSMKEACEADNKDGNKCGSDCSGSAIVGVVCLPPLLHSSRRE